MKTYRRTDLPRYIGWEEDKAGPGQWDGISGRVLGNWANHATARAYLLGKKLSYGLGFFADSDSLRTRWTAGGLIELDFTARGLFAEKFKRIEYGQENAMSAEEVAINAPGYSYSNLWDRVEYDIPTPVIEVNYCGSLAPDLIKTGLTISGTPFWLAKTGGLPAGPANPWSPGSGQAYTVHYPSGWIMQIVPGDSIGRMAASNSLERLHMTTYRAVWRHKITP